MMPEPVSADGLASFGGLIEERCGLHFDESHRGQLAAAVQARMQQLGLVDVGEYYQRLHNRVSMAVDEEFRHLINMVTVTETCFFRNPSHFRLLRQHILPALLAGSPRTLRIWSAGSSSGEEAYSIALTLWDMGLYLGKPDWTFEIAGTDLNTDVLEVARLGTYAARALRNVDGDALQRYFRRDGDRFHLNDEIKRCVRFEHGNLMDSPIRVPGAALQDIIFCKNVTIYFQPDVTRRLIGELHGALADGGYLLLGHSESLWQMSDGFELVERDRAYCYRKITAPRDAASTAGNGPVVSASAEPDRGCEGGLQRNSGGVGLRRVRPLPRIVPGRGVVERRGVSRQADSFLPDVRAGTSSAGGCVRAQRPLR